MARFSRSTVFTNVDSHAPEFTPKINSDGSTERSELTLFVSGLDDRVTELTLYQLFSPVGNVTECQILFNKDKNDPKFGRPRGVAFVTFSTRADAERAIASLNGRLVGSRKIAVKFAYERVPVTLGSPAPPVAAPVTPLNDAERRLAIAAIRNKLAQLRPAEAVKRKTADESSEHEERDEKKSRTTEQHEPNVTEPPTTSAEPPPPPPPPASPPPPPPPPPEV
jgi:RNA recognition motif-containing protein